MAINFRKDNSGKGSFTMKRKNGRPLPLGTTVHGTCVNFSVAVEEEKTCRLLLYRIGTEEPEQSFEMTKEDAIGEVRFLSVEGIDARKYEYNYEIDGKLIMDPYVKEIAGKKCWGQGSEQQEMKIRGKLVSSTYDWEEDKLLKIPEEEVVAYNLHVRGFTKDRSSRIRKKGTFAGVIEKIPYLLELGINQIHCMPVYEFEECSDKYINYWGYGPAYCFAPKAAYASNGHSVKELKDMVKACHKAGIEVILNLPFDESIHPQMIVECLHAYLMEYHVDGFVLNPVLAPMNSILKDPLLKGLKIICYDNGFQNSIRRFLKGDEGMVPEVMWQMRRLPKADHTINYITNHTGFTLIDLVSYDTKHNEENGENNADGPEYNFSWNCGMEGPTRKKQILKLRDGQIRNAFLMLLLSQGTPCILAGDEFGNSQNGNNNVYCQDNETGWLNWHRGMREMELTEFVKELIRFRKDHPVLHQRNLLLGMDQKSCGVPDISYHGENAWQAPDQYESRQLGVFLSGEALETEDCFIALNMHWVEHTFAIPTLPKSKEWNLSVSTQDGVLENPMPLGKKKSIIVPGRTIVVLTGRNKEEETDERD